MFIPKPSSEKHDSLIGLLVRWYSSYYIRPMEVKGKGEFFSILVRIDPSSFLSFLYFLFSYYFSFRRRIMTWVLEGPCRWSRPTSNVLCSCRSKTMTIFLRNNYSAGLRQKKKNPSMLKKRLHQLALRWVAHWWNIKHMKSRAKRKPLKNFCGCLWLLWWRLK